MFAHYIVRSPNNFFTEITAQVLFPFQPYVVSYLLYHICSNQEMLSRDLEAKLLIMLELEPEVQN